MANPNSAKFPAALVSDVDLTVASDAYTSALVQPLDASSVTAQVASVTGLYTPCLLLFDSNEIILAQSNTGTILTNLIRGISNTTPVPHNVGSKVSSNIFAYQFNQLAAEIKAIQNFLGINGNNLTLKGSPVLGDVSGNLPNLSLQSISGLVAGEYFQPIITVDSKGRIVSAIAGTYSQLFSTVTTLNVAHFLNNQNVIVSVYDQTGTVIDGATITIVDNNNLTVSFAVSQSGRVVVK